MLVHTVTNATTTTKSATNTGAFNNTDTNFPKRLLARNQAVCVILSMAATTQNTTKTSNVFAAKSRTASPPLNVTILYQCAPTIKTNKKITALLNAIPNFLPNNFSEARPQNTSNLAPQVNTPSNKRSANVFCAALRFVCSHVSCLESLDPGCLRLFSLRSWTAMALPIWLTAPISIPISHLLALLS